MSPNHTCDLEEIPDPSPKPPKKTCKKCFSTPPFSKCTQHLCSKCCGDMMCYFKKGHDTWWLSKPSYENVIQLWPKVQLWPRESTENQFLECNNCNSLFPCHNNKILLLLLLHLEILTRSSNEQSSTDRPLSGRRLHYWSAAATGPTGRLPHYYEVLLKNGNFLHKTKHHYDLHWMQIIIMIHTMCVFN